MVSARTIVGTLGDAQERVGLRPARAFTTFAGHVATLLTAPSLRSTTSAALAGTAAIDSSESTLGPIFLDHAETLGRGVTNLNVISQRSFAQGSLLGAPFSGLGLTAPPVVTRRTPTAHPASPALLGVRLHYTLDLHVWAVALAVSYGITDALDVSLVLPVVADRLDLATTARVVAATGPTGGAFTRVADAPTLGGTLEPVQSTGIGDLVLRGKVRLSVPAPWHAAATLELQFPTGDLMQLHGTGDTWITPGLDVAYPFAVGSRRAELDASAGLNFDIPHSLRSQALYGLSASMVLWPKRLGAIVEFLGQSQFDSAFRPNSTDVLVLTPGGIQPDPLLGVGWTARLDQWDFSFGLRAVLLPGILVFANGAVALNPAAGVRPAGVVPTIGIGASF
jgi:hypothetical protein